MGGLAFEQGLLGALTLSLRSAPTADNSQPFSIHPTGSSSFTVCYAADRIGGETFPALAPATLLALGAALESIHQTAESLGVAVAVQRWPAAHPDAYVEIAWDGAMVPQRSTFAPASAILARHTNRFPYLRTAVPAATLGLIGSLEQGAARARAIVGEPMGEVAALVRSASEVRFQTREVHEWLGRSLRFTADQVARGDGLDIATLALPPGGSALLRFLAPWPRMRAMNSVGAFRLMAAIEALPVRAGPALVAIIAPPSRDSLVDAGRLMQRAWVELNAAGLAVHPYYVVSDQLQRLAEGTVPEALVTQVTGLARSCQAVFGLEQSEQLQMLFRVGYPSRQAPRSRRLPLSALIRA